MALSIRGLILNVPTMASTSSGGGGSAPSATTLRMSHLSAGRPYVTFLAPAETNADGLRRLHIKTFADSAS